MMRVLVTGGSGFLGMNLCGFLREKNYAVVNIDLAPFNYPEIKGVDSFLGSILDEELLEKALVGVDVVVHSAAALPLDTPENIKRTNLLGTELLVRKALAANVKRFIYISSTAVYGFPSRVPITEDFPLDGIGPYGRAKVEAEKIVVSIRDQMVATIIRPKSFLGLGRLGIFSIVFDWIASNKNIPVIGNGNNLYQLLDVYDLCTAIELCMTKSPNLVNDTFNIGATEFGTIRSDLSYVLEMAETKKRVVGLPKDLTIGALRALEFLRLSPIYSWVYETAAKESHVSVDKFMHATNWQPKYSNKESLWLSYQDYLKHRDEIVESSGSGHRVQWKQGAIKLVKAFF